MQDSLRKLVILLLASSFLLSACSALNYTTPGSLIPGLAQTLAAETMTAQEQSQLDIESQEQQQSNQGTDSAYEYVPTGTPAPMGTPIPMLTPFFSNSKVGSANNCVNAAAFI